MNIMLLAAEFPPRMRGGMANYSYNIAKRLAANNNVKVMSLPEYSAGKNYALNLRFICDAARELRRARKKRKKVIVYAISFRPEFSLIGFYAKKLGIPLVFNGVGLDMYTTHPAFVFARRIACKISNQIICGASFQKGILIKNGAIPTKIHTILGGVDTERFEPSLGDRDKLRRLFGIENKFVLLSLGRLVKRKGFDDAIKALAHLKDIEDIILLIVGDGQEKASLKKLARNLSVEEKVKFLGFVSSDILPKIYNAAELFVAPFKIIGRDMEGFPLVAQEAQACGVPVISTNTAGVPELIENDKTGFLVHMNSPKEIAEQIRTLYEDGRLRKEMASNARKRAEELLDWAVVVTKIENVLRVALRQT